MSATVATHADTIRVYRAGLVAALDRIEAWVYQHTDDIESVHAFADAVYVHPHWGDEEAYHRVVESLPEIVDLSDPDAITPPGEDSFYTRAKVGPVTVSVPAPVSLCTRVQVGTRVVERPDPDAPMVEVVEPVYEYRCDGDEVAS